MVRRSTLLFFVIVALIVTYLVHSVSTLITLLFEDFSADAIHRSELSFGNSSVHENKPQLIPRIIHQTCKNDTIPVIWREAQKSCLRLHDGYKYMLWTDEKSLDFIARNYPWFLETFQSYKHPIQRADAIRYFVLAHYGGIYLDLDDGCNRRLDPLLSFPAWVRQTSPSGISNDAMGAMPQHPFYLRVIDSLQTYNRSWLLPYITVMYSTGPLFLSVIWKLYMQSRPEGLENRVHVLRRDEYDRYSWSFFKIRQGNSWHGQDARWIFWMSKNWFLLTLTGFFLAFLVFRTLYKLYNRCMGLSIFSRCSAKLDRTPLIPAPLSSKGKATHHKKSRRTISRKKRPSLTLTPDEEKIALSANHRRSTPYAIDVSEHSTCSSPDPVSESSPERHGRQHHGRLHVAHHDESRLGVPMLHRFISRSLSRGRSSTEASGSSASSRAHSDVEAQVRGHTMTNILSRKR